VVLTQTGIRPTEGKYFSGGTNPIAAYSYMEPSCYFLVCFAGVASPSWSSSTLSRRRQCCESFEIGSLSFKSYICSFFVASFLSQKEKSFSKKEKIHKGGNISKYKKAGIDQERWSSFHTTWSRVGLRWAYRWGEIPLGDSKILNLAHVGRRRWLHTVSKACVGGEKDKGQKRFFF